MGSVVITGIVVFLLALVGQNAARNASRLLSASVRRASGRHRSQLPEMTLAEQVAVHGVLVVVSPIIGWFVVCASSSQHRQVVAALARGALPFVAERAGWCDHCAAAVDEEILMWEQS